MSVDPKSLKSPFDKSYTYNAAVRCEALFTKLNPDSKQQAKDFVNSMRSIYSGTNITGVSEVMDLQTKLLNILKYDESYMKAHTNAEGNPEKLITDAKDVNGTKTKIDEYGTFVDGMPEISLEDFFKDYFLKIYKQFKSSDAYIERLVKAILTAYNAEHPTKYTTSESTRLLIAKRFIEQFGYFDIFNEPEFTNSSLSKKFDSSALKEYVESNYRGDFMQMDESVFDNIKEDTTYLSTVSHLIGAIKYKAPLTVVNKKMCEQLCEIIKSDKLSDSAKNSTAFLLSECLSSESSYKDMKADWLIIPENETETDKTNREKTYKNLTNAINKNFNDHTKALTPEHFAPYEILYVLMKGFSHDIACPKKVFNILKKHFRLKSPEETRQESTKLNDLFWIDEIELADCIKLSDIENIAIPLLKMARKKNNENAIHTYGCGLKDSEFVAQAKICIPESNTFKKLDRISYDRFPYAVRFATLIETYSAKIPANESLVETLKQINAFKIGRIEYRSDAANLHEIIENQENTLKKARDYGDLDPAIERFVTKVEKLLSENDDFDPNEYLKALKEKTNSRYTEGTKSKARIYQDAADTLCKNTQGFKLLEIANAISNSKFSGQDESSREYLYLFALAFGMRYDSSHSTMPGFYDIESNLFEDYYCDNLINDLSAATNPISGHGINYKNFAEVTFLWGLHRLGTGKTAKDILREIYHVINHCFVNGKTYEEFEPDVAPGGVLNNSDLTGIYREKFATDKVVNMNEDDLKEYNITHYACQTNGNYFGINSDNRTAKSVADKYLCEFLTFWSKKTAEYYEIGNDFQIDNRFLTDISDNKDVKLIIQKITKRLKIFSDETIETANIDFTPVEHDEAEHDKTKHDSAENDDTDHKETCNDGEANNDFTAYLTSVTTLFSEVAFPEEEYDEESEKKEADKDKISIPKLSYYSRTSIIALCFYMYLFACNADKENENPQLTNSPSLEQVYDTFAENKYAMENLFGYPGANTILREAGYQEINPKNIYDMYIIFIIYSILHS